MFAAFPQCNFTLEFSEILRNTCYNWLSESGITKKCIVGYSVKHTIIWTGIIGALIFTSFISSKTWFLTLDADFKAYISDSFTNNPSYPPSGYSLRIRPLSCIKCINSLSNFNIILKWLLIFSISPWRNKRPLHFNKQANSIRLLLIIAS